MSEQPHLPRYQRRAIGKSPIGGRGNRNRYATAVECSCGWVDRSNGNKKRDALREFGRHVRLMRLSQPGGSDAE